MIFTNMSFADDYKDVKAYKDWKGDPYTVSDLARGVFGDQDLLRISNSSTFYDLSANRLPGNYKERFNEKVVMEYGYIDNMDYKGLQRVYRDLKKAMGKLGTDHTFEYLDYRTLPKADRETMLRANIELLYDFYFRYSPYTVEYSKGYQDNIDVTSYIADLLIKEMHKYEGFSGVDTYKENLNILREYYGDDLSALYKDIYLGSLFSNDIAVPYAKSSYYIAKKELNYIEEGMTDDIDDDEETEDNYLSDYEMMKLADFLVSQIENKKSAKRPPAKIVKTPRVK